jgi:NADH-ubiquinone oxidoreductase chain 6
MTNNNFLYILNENITNGFQSITLDFITIAAILSGIFVIVSKNPIVSVLFLIGLFLTISIYLMILGVNFIGLSYLLVYVGAVSILFLFILMLINVRISEIVSSTSNSIPLAIIIGSLFFSTVYQALPVTLYYGNKQYIGFNILKHEISKYFYSFYDFFTGPVQANSINTTGNSSITGNLEFKHSSLEYVSSQA